MCRTLFALALLAAVTWPSADARADGACDADCPEGQVKTGFLDGQSGTCVCLPEGSPMEDVVPEVSVGTENPGA